MLLSCFCLVERRDTADTFRWLPREVSSPVLAFRNPAGSCDAALVIDENLITIKIDENVCIYHKQLTLLLVNSSLVTTTTEQWGMYIILCPTCGRSAVLIVSTMCQAVCR